MYLVSNFTNLAEEKFDEVFTEIFLDADQEYSGLVNRRTAVDLAIFWYA